MLRPCNWQVDVIMHDLAAIKTSIAEIERCYRRSLEHSDVPRCILSAGPSNTEDSLHKLMDSVRFLLSLCSSGSACVSSPLHSPKGPRIRSFLAIAITLSDPRVGRLRSRWRVSRAGWLTCNATSTWRARCAFRPRPSVGLPHFQAESTQREPAWRWNQSGASLIPPTLGDRVPAADPLHQSLLHEDRLATTARAG
jgi:hypothetical protein